MSMSKNVLRLGDEVSFVADGLVRIGDILTFEHDKVKVLVGERKFDVNMSELCFLEDAALWRNLALRLMLALVDEVRHSKEPAKAALEVMNLAQAEFGCECHFAVPYGWVVSADCPYHD